MLKRHFVAFAAEVDRAPPPLPLLFKKTGGETLPYVVFIDERGRYIHGSSGEKSPEGLISDMEKVLEEKTLAAKGRDADLRKHVNALEQALQAKQYKEATTAWSALTRIRGYSSIKDKGYDLMDAAQADAAKKVEEAIGHAERDEYANARKLLEAVAKESAGLPIAGEAKEQLAPLKLLEAAHQATEGKKGAWKRTAIQKYQQVLKQYGDTPLARLAAQRQRDVLKS